MKSFQDFIVPVFRVNDQNGRLRATQLHGTAFFINSRGAFITAKHVVEEANESTKKYGGNIALSMRKSGDDRWYAGHIQDITFADDPYDLAIGYVAEPSRACFAPANTKKILVWDDVHTAGYAESAVSRRDSNLRPDIRALRGYVVRKVPPGEFLSKVGPHPSAFEVDFAVPLCMSGAPLMMRYGPDETPPPGAPFPLLGVCTGTEEIIVGKDATEYYGVAHDLWPLMDWKPNCLGGETLAEAIRPEG